MTITKRLKVLLIAVLLVVSIIFSGQATLSAISFCYAETTVYSDVLDDLEKDENFNLQDYPQIAGSYDIELIQIAESTTGELLLYVYQPGNGTLEEDVECIFVNISFDEEIDSTTEELKYERKDLTLLDSTSTFCKYKVNDFIVSKNTYRYYTMSAIYRPWISGVDESPEPGVSIDGIPFSVGWTWKVYFLNNKLKYEKSKANYFKTTTLIPGWVRYDNGFTLWNHSACDSHFVAFNAEIPIDDILRAKVSYDYQFYESVVSVGEVVTPIGEVEKDQTAICNKDDYVSFSPSGLFTVRDYSWNRIEKTSDFADKENFSCLDNSLTEEYFRENSQWVLRFLETEVSSSSGTNIVGSPYIKTEFTKVSKVSILELYFVSKGETFNLGVVSNIATGSQINDVNETFLNELKREFKEIWEKIEKVLFIVILILICIIVSPILNFILGFFKSLFKGLKIILSIILFPFKLIFKKRRNN